MRVCSGFRDGIGIGSLLVRVHYSIVPRYGRCRSRLRRHRAPEQKANVYASKRYQFTSHFNRRACVRHLYFAIVAKECKNAFLICPCSFVWLSEVCLTQALLAKWTMCIHCQCEQFSSSGLSFFLSQSIRCRCVRVCVAKYLQFSFGLCQPFQRKLIAPKSKTIVRNQFEKIQYL